jgi:hypothetical protein
MMMMMGALQRAYPGATWTHIHGTPPIERRQWQPCALPTPNMCDAIGTHSQAMGGWKWVPTHFIEATAKLLLCLGHQWITADKLACAHTPQVGSRAHHASTPYQRDIYWAWCTIKACKASCHQPCRSPKGSREPTQHSHHTIVRYAQQQAAAIKCKHGNCNTRVQASKHA